MNFRPLISILAGLAGVASAELVPILSEPRSVPLNAISYDAWGDTLVASRWGATYRLVRKGDQVVLLDSIKSDSLRSEMPRTFLLDNGTHLQVSETWLATLDWTTRTAGVALSGIGIGYDRAEGELFRKTNNDTLFGFLCAERGSFIVKRPPEKAWQLVSSLPLAAGYAQHCAVDPVSRSSVRFTYAPDGGDSSRLEAGDALWQHSWIADVSQALPIRPTTAFVTSVGWLAYNDSTGKIMIHYDPGFDAPPTDTILYPEALSKLADKYTTPVRRDSLIVFGGDSTLVLAGWSRKRFQIYQTVQLDSKISHAMALGDSTLWVQTANKVLSFRVQWKTPSQSGIQSRQVGSTLPLRIDQQDGRLLATWNASTSTPILVLGIDGSVISQRMIGPHERIEIPLSGRKGVLLLRTNAGTSPTIVK